MEQLVLSCLESRVEENRSIYGRFLLGAFRNGDALTVATALRRSLLSQGQSVAIIALDIQGVSHEFSTITGVRESVLEVTLNFQQIILRADTDLKNTQVGYLQVQGPGVVYANDLKLPKGIECVDPTQYIATLARDGLLVIKFLIAGNAHTKHLKINNTQINSQQLRQVKKVLDGKQFQAQACLQNILPLDSFLSPVNRVNFTVEKDDLFNQARERILLEIWTNGSIHPRQALNQAVFSLLTIFSAFRNVTQLDSHSSWLKPDPPEVRGSSKEFAFDGLRPSQQKLADFGNKASESKDPADFSSRKSFERKTSSQIDSSKRDLSAVVRPNLTNGLSVLYRTNLDKMSLLASDISNLSFSLKTYIFLKQKGINKLEHLLEHSPQKLLDLVNGNKNMFYDIKRCLFALGLQLQ